MTESLKNSEEVGAGSAEWDSLGSVEFQGGAAKEDSADRALREQAYVDAAKRQETYRQGLDTRDNAEKADAIKKNIETLYHMGDTEGAESQIKAKDDLEAQKIVPAGKEAMMVGNTEEAAISRGAATEALAKAEFNAMEYAKENVTPQNANELVIRERVRYEALKKRYDKWHEPGYKEPTGFFEKREHKKMVEETMKELSRFGFDPSRRTTSPTIEMYGQKTPSGSEVLDFGKSRAADYSELTTLASGKYSRAVRKALKKQGFGDMPKDWSDKDFTTHEIALMSQVAQSTVRGLTYREK
ncbi:hypothetical protein IKG07_02200 [Candidatus Saccharibacteria bacterium]|nr:hypothetical protein [Candidatus Saccharibacteria bacterium]